VRVPITLCVVAMNEEDRLPACLASVPFADEVLVVDSHSTDRTREIASAAGARVIERDWPGHVAQKEFAVREARSEWILILDADEVCSPALREEIEAARAAGFLGADGYSMPRATLYLGRRMRFGGFRPQRKVRLFDRRRGRIAGTDPHDRVEIEGSVRRMRGSIEHRTYRSLEEHLRAIERYTDLMALEMLRAGRRARPWDPVLHAVSRFLLFYVVKAGLLEGAVGYHQARLAARYAWLKYAKRRRMGSGSVSGEGVRHRFPRAGNKARPRNGA